jgi:hypothetical protein
VLKNVGKRFGGRLARNCAVETGSVIEVNQQVDLT